MRSPLFTALAASLALHAAAGGAYLGSFLPSLTAPEEEPITISYVRYSPERRTPVRHQRQIEQLPIAPVPKPFTAPNKAKIEKIGVRPLGLNPVKAGSDPMNPVKAGPGPVRPIKRGSDPAVPLIRESRELLADPVEGRLFTNYFGAVKDKIHQTVRRKYGYRSVGRGSGALLFILRSDGALESAEVVRAYSSAGQTAREVALESLRQADPFPPFPQGIELKKISFNVTIL